MSEPSASSVSCGYLAQREHLELEVEEDLLRDVALEHVAEHADLVELFVDVAVVHVEARRGEGVVLHVQVALGQLEELEVREVVRVRVQQVGQSEGLELLRVVEGVGLRADAVRPREQQLEVSEVAEVQREVDYVFE